MPDDVQYPEWMTGLDLPDELKGSPVLLDTPDVPTLAKRLVDNHAMVGRSLRIPGEHATDEDRAKFQEDLMAKVPGLMPTPDLNDDKALEALYTRLGRPEEAAKYEVPQIDGQALTMDDQTVAAFAELSYKAGLSQKQFAMLLKEVGQASADSVAAHQDALKKGMEGLAGEWGQNFESRKTGVLNLLRQTNAPEPLLNAFNNGQVDAATIKWLHEVKKLFGSEGSQLVDQDTGSEPGLDAAEAQQRADEIFKQLQSMPPGDPRYQRLMNKRVELIKIASGSKE